VSGLDRRLEPEGETRRFEVINGAMGRRRWSADDRARILEETLAPGAVVSAVARRHGLTPPQLFTWRRSARKQLEAEAPPTFVPAVVVAPEPGVAKEPTARAKRRAPRKRVAALEMEASGVTVRIGDGTSPATIAAVIRALQSAS
jgi:transposase